MQWTFQASNMFGVYLDEAYEYRQLLIEAIEQWLADMESVT